MGGRSKINENGKKKKKANHNHANMNPIYNLRWFKLALIKI